MNNLNLNKMDYTPITKPDNKRMSNFPDPTTFMYCFSVTQLLGVCINSNSTQMTQVKIWTFKM